MPRCSPRRIRTRRRSRSSLMRRRRHRSPISRRMLRYHTHHHHPVGEVLKRELKAYADDLKSVAGLQAEHRYRQIRGAHLCRRIRCLTASPSGAPRLSRAPVRASWVRESGRRHSRQRRVDRVRPVLPVVAGCRRLVADALARHRRVRRRGDRAVRHRRRRLPRLRRDGLAPARAVARRARRCS